MSHITFPAASPLLTLDEAAEILGKSPKQLRWMVYKATGPKSAKIGGRRVFRLSDVETFIEAAFAAEDSRAA